MKITYYHYPHQYNVGDTLTPYLLEYFLPDAELERVDERAQGKLLAVGSIMRCVKPSDIVWGTGIMREFPHLMPFGAEFLAVRGPYTRNLLRGVNPVPEVYGDPALLLPLMYSPPVAKRYAVGVVPHYVDKAQIAARIGGADASMQGWHLIDVALPWRAFVDEVLACERIVSSSLHGIVIAEAYGIPAEWAVYSHKVIGHGFKFRDYVAGTGRDGEHVKPGDPLPPIENLDTIQRGLVDALQRRFPSTRARKPQCEGKRRFAKRDAATYIHHARGEGRILRAYQCPECDGWHLTKYGDNGDKLY